MQGIEQPLQGMKLQEKEAHMKSVYNEPTVKKMYVNSRLKATKIIGQRKASYIGREFQSLGKKLLT